MKQYLLKEDRLPTKLTVVFSPDPVDDRSVAIYVHGLASGAADTSSTIKLISKIVDKE